MKKVLLSLVLILGSASTVLAQRQGGNGQGNGQVVGGIGLASCRADMIARNGNIITSFTGNNCQQALRQCEIDLQNRHQQGQNLQAICQTVNNGGGNNGGSQPAPYPGDGGHNGGGGNNGPRPGNPNISCQADMIARSGRIIVSFTGNNCNQAIRQCQNDLQRRQSQGLNPYAICQISSNNGNNGGGGQRPPPPPPPVQNDYGPAQTVRWQDFGSTKLDKVVIERITIRANNSYVNEILLRASGSDIRIERVAIILTSGQIYHLPHQAGIISDNREVRLRLDQRYSLRVSHIEIEATTAGLFGSRGRLQTILGLAY